MKKIVSIFIALIFTSFNACFAFSELFYLKNVQVDSIKPFVTDSYSSYNYNIEKYDPYYGRSYSDPSNYAVVILQQSGNNAFYYYQSNGSKKISNAILKKIKRNGIVYEESYNSSIMSVYDRLAQDLMSGTSNANRYTFEEPIVLNKQQSQYKTQQNSAYSNNSLRGGVAHLDSGAKLNVYLQTSINTATAQKGDQIIAVLMQDVVYNGVVVFPQGSLVYGTLTKAVHASYGSRNGKVVIQFNQIVTPENKTYAISTEKVDFAVTNDGKVKSVVTSAATGAIIGAVGGLLYAALSGGNIGTATAIGAGVGAGTGLAASAIEQGVDAEIPSFTEMELVLTKSVSVTVSY
ncbi:MAG: glycine zipper family protein [Candidatus Gastranaerophilaceae bacterium]|nr:glycine zipper family protein [Candidatus Gastranaerophilaceae bacterium]